VFLIVSLAVLSFKTTKFKKECDFNMLTSMNKKAVSSILAAVILIAITVVSVVLVTSLFLSRFNESANQCKLLVLSFNLFADIHGEHPLITFTVKNIGTEQINNIDLVVNGEPVIPFNLTSPMNAGDTRAFQTELNDAFAIGDYYSYTIRASTPKGNSCAVANTVLCDWYSGEVSGQTYVLTIIDPPNGAFNLAAGTHTYNSGTVVGVQATLGAGYMFDHWVLDGSDAGTSNPLQITMNRDHTVTASFQASGITEGDYSSWTHSWESTEFGEASPTYVSQVIIDEGQGTMCVQWNYGTFTVYSLTNGAVLASGPSEAYDWIAGPYQSVGGKYYLTITNDGYVEVRSGARLLQMIFSSDWNCIAISPGGRYVVLITRWPSVRVDVFEGVATGPQVVTVNFSTLSLSTSNWGTINVDSSPITIPQSIPLSVGSHSVEFVPPTYYSFDHWEVTGGVAVDISSANPTSITVTGDGTVTAVYIMEQYTLTVVAADHGSFDLPVGPHVYDAGTVVQVQAVPDADYVLNQSE
jgi:flagellin-like protein